MEEKVLIQSKKFNIKKLFQIFVITGAFLSVLLSVIFTLDDMSYYNRNYGENHEHYSRCYKWPDDYYDDKRDDGILNNEDKMDCPQIIYGSAIGYAFHSLDNYYYLPTLIPFVSMALLGGLIYLWLRSYELTVTDKRVYGKVQFGKRVDLPVDSVSATATIQLLKGVSVSTSSGKISFLAIKNANEIYSTINNLLIERQQKKESVVTKVEAKVDETEQLTKYKELLDKGVITQEEFDAKKKQLLGL